MKRILILLSLLTFGASAGAYGQSGRYVDDLYRGSTRKSRETEAQKRNAVRQAKQMPATWTPAQDAAAARSVATNAANPTDRPELVTGYEEALQRRLDAYKSYREMDDSYWQLMEGYHQMLSRKYDPDLYNVITFGNEMWVEPVYITAAFDGSDPTGGVGDKQLFLPTESRSDIHISLNFGPNRWWVDPWDYGWYGPWGYPSWRWNYYWGAGYWGPSWSWSWNWGWGPSWSWGPSWGWGPAWGPAWGPTWGPAWGPGYHPPYWGGGHGPHQPARPVIWGGGHRPAVRPAPGYRPGEGSPTGRPTYQGGYRRNENGTGVAIDNNGGSTGRRPGSMIRPGSSGNQYNSGTATRPMVNDHTNTNTSRPTTDRSYRRETTTTPTQTRRETTTRTETPHRSEPSYSAPSRGSSGGSYGGGGGGSVGGGYRRR